MTQFLALLITGSVSGGIYAILSSGLVLTYVTTGVFNFAYGAIAYSVAYVYYQLHTGLDWPTPVAAVVALLVFAPLLGLLLDRAIFQNLARAPGVSRVIATIGILVALPNLVVLISDWLSTTVGLDLARRNEVLQPPGLGPYPPKTWLIARGATINSNQLAVFAAAVVISVALWLITRHTRVGLDMRAVVDRRALSELRGVNASRVSTQATLLGSVIAGLAGILIAPLFSLDPNGFTLLMFIAAAGAVLGGLRSIPIAMVGGLSLGVIQSMVAGYVTISPNLLPGLRSTVPFAVLFGALFFLGAAKGRAAGSVADDHPPIDYLSDLPSWRRFLPWTVMLVILVVWMQFASDFYATLVGRGLALGIVFLSFVIITGAGGMVSLAQAAFAAFGALVAATVIEHGVPFLPAALIGALAACILVLVVGAPSLRLGGPWLALATLAAGFIADQMLFRVPAINGTGQGRKIPRPKFGPFDFDHPASFAMLLLVVFGVLAVGVRNLLRSPTGRVMIGMRSSEVAAATSGASTIFPKFVLFGASAAIAGIGGTLLAAQNYRIDPLTYPTPVGMIWIAVVAVWGVRRIGGALLAGLIVPLFPELLRHATSSTLIPPILFGLGAVSLSQNPDGILAIEGIKRYEKRQARARKAELAFAAQQPEPASQPIVTHVAPAAPTAPLDASHGLALELRGVHAGYDGVAVLRDIDLTIPQGSFVLVVGANGAGKSTLCSVISGLLAPTAGTVLFEGNDITKLKPHQRVKSGLILAPEYRGIFPNLSVEDNVAVWMSDQKARQRALRRFPVLAERRRQQAQLLSGGQQQMLALAALLEAPPSMLIIDEPSLGLAPSATRQVFEALKEMHAAGTTVLVIEEQARRALEVAESVVMLDNGRVVWTGSANSVTDELTDQLFVGKAAQ